MVDEQPLFILAGNGPYENRGCEAIVRGTTKILREHFQNPRFICLSIFQSEEQFQAQIGQENDPAITHLNAHTLSRKQIVRNIWRPETLEGFCRYFFNRKSFASWVFKDMLPFLDEATAVLSVGGDNYSLDYGIPTRFTELDDLVLASDRPLAIWGASVGPFSTQPEYEQYMSDHLEKVTGIFARESASVNYLESIGVKRNVFPVADPAFLMEPVKPVAIEERMPIENGGIGLNLSSLLAKYVTGGDLETWTTIASSIIRDVARTTEMPIYLIPHVTVTRSDDHAFMVNAAAQVQDGRRITVVPPIYSAAETKWIISQMDLFAGARTHATIASLSSCIPTLSFAYSIKAHGINRDVFGHTQYCIEPNELEPSLVTKRIISILNDADAIQRELRTSIPGVQKAAMQAGGTLRKIVREA